MFVGVLERYFECVGGCAPDERDALLASGGIVLASVFPSIEAALAISAESRTGLVIQSKESEVAYLKGVSFEPPKSRGVSIFQRIPYPRLPLRRSAQVTSWWTPSWKVPAALMRPDIVAISDNPLLVSGARDSNARIGFVHAGTIFRRMRRRQANVRHGVDVAALAASLVGKILDMPCLTEPVRSRLQEILSTHVSSCVELAAHDLAAAARYPRMPNIVWSGTGGNYAGRVIGLEVMRRGGTVVRYDHGGTLAMAYAPTTASIAELSVSSRFVVGTDVLGEFLRSTNPDAPIAAWHAVDIEGGMGDPSMRGLALNAQRRNSNRRKILYVPMFLRGFSKHAFYTFSDPVYLDWQLRLAGELSKMPADLLCKPHPEGVLSGRVHPLSQVASCSTAPFEAEMGNADVFVFDRCSSTTFWRAVCTDRPVILIPIGPPDLNLLARQALERRCIIIEPRYDENNLPQIDHELLSEAVLGGPDRVDPTEMRKIFMGRYAAEVS